MLRNASTPLQMSHLVTVFHAGSSSMVDPVGCLTRSSTPLAGQEGAPPAGRFTLYEEPVHLFPLVNVFNPLGLLKLVALNSTFFLLYLELLFLSPLREPSLFQGNSFFSSGGTNFLGAIPSHFYPQNECILPRRNSFYCLPSVSERDRPFGTPQCQNPKIPCESPSPFSPQRTLTSTE